MAMVIIFFLLFFFVLFLLDVRVQLLVALGHFISQYNDFVSLFDKVKDDFFDALVHHQHHE